MSMTTYTFKEQTECLMCHMPSLRNSVLGLRMNCRQGWKPKRNSGFAVTIRRCIHCGLTYPDPLPVPTRIEDHYDIPPESYWTDDYFIFDENYLRSEIQHAKKLLAVTNRESATPPRALDIGAGIGKGMAALMRSGFEAWGIEPSSSFRRMAIDRAGISPERIQLSSVEAAQWPHDHFHYITFGAVLEHLYNPSLCLERAFSWLRPGGIIHAEVPSSNYLLHQLLNSYYRLIGTSFVANLSPMHPPFHLYEFTPQSFEALGKQIGFLLEEHSYHPASGRFVPRHLYPLFFRWMKATNSGMQLTVWLRKPFN